MPHALLVAVNELPFFALDEAFLAQFDVQTLQRVCQAATNEALTLMAPTVIPPILTWGDDLRQPVGKIIAYELKSLKGLAPTDAAVGDENVTSRAIAARALLERVGKGELAFQDFLDSSGNQGDAILVDPLSDPPRGW